MRFTTDPIEIRFADRQGKIKYVLCASITSQGTIHYALDNGKGGPPESLSNLQSQGIFPKKAVAGWHQDVQVAAQAGIYRVHEVR
jgi:hypothetical protein